MPYKIQNGHLIWVEPTDLVALTMLIQTFNPTTTKGRLLIVQHLVDKLNAKKKTKSTNESDNIHPRKVKRKAVKLDSNGEPNIQESEVKVLGPNGAVPTTFISGAFNGLGSMLGGGNEVPKEGDALGDVMLATAPIGEAFNYGMRFMPWLIKNAVANAYLWKLPFSVKNSATTPKAFKSELDWSPESWFGLRRNKKYTSEDVEALKSHLAEYNAIEQLSKQEGWWLKMPDGSTWQGDPRSWVQLMSLDGQKLVPKAHYAATPYYSGRADNFPTYTGDVWTGNTPESVLEYTYSKAGKTPKKLTEAEYLAEKQKWLERFDAEPELWRLEARDNILSKLEADWKFSQGDPYAGGEIYLVTYPANATTNDINAYGRNWGNIDDGFVADLDGGFPIKEGLSTDAFVANNAKQGYDVSRVFNVKDSRSVPFMDDIIIHSGTPRKSLLGNNGNFNLTDKNIYRSLGIPIIGLGMASQTE